jgi:hypothetical protein
LIPASVTKKIIQFERGVVKYCLFHLHRFHSIAGINNLQTMRQFLNSKWIFIFPWFLLAVNLVLKGTYLTSGDITPAEAFTVYHAQFNVDVMTGHLKALNIMPFYSILLHFWIKMFGISPLAVRSLPMLIASFCPSLLFWITRRYFSTFVSVTAALLFSGSALLLRYAHESSAYALSALLAVLCARLYLDVFSGNGGPVKVVLLVFANAALVYTRYAGWFLIFLQCFHFLFFRKHPLKFLPVMVALLLIYWPWLIVVFNFLFIPNVPREPAHPGIESLYNWLWALCNQPVITVGAIGVLIAGLVLFIVRRKAFSTPTLPAFISGWFAIPYLCIFVVSFFHPVYRSGDLVVAMPGFYLLLALCLEAMPGKVWSAAAFILAFGFTLFLDRRASPPVQQLVSQVKAVKRPQTIVLGPYRLMLPFAYYYNPDYFGAVNDHLRNHLTDSLLRTEQIYFINDPGEFASILQRKAPLIFITHAKDADHALIESLERHYSSNRIVNLDDTYLVYFMEGPADVK